MSGDREPLLDMLTGLLALTRHRPTPRCAYCAAWIVDGPGLTEGLQVYCDSFCYHDAGPDLLADDRAERVLDHGYDDEVPF